MMRRARPTILALLALLAIGAAGCDTTGPGADDGDGDDAGTPPVGPDEIRAVVEPDDTTAVPGDTVTLTVRLLTGEDAPAPLGVTAAVEWTPGDLQPVSPPDTETSPGRVLAVNPTAADGLALAAGATVDGFADGPLFTVDVEVARDGWTDGLTVDLPELYTGDTGGG